ncbi:Branched-chain amino acid transport protein [Desulfocicer vacuolatum DSM 3385]|uniref:Branched-chain amino acid transport protein n=1 Tax=Desulfocicer vacuolatum DSM 3385 TaxID=1121400 RepID=A0A1W2A243_9BACT|nr:AzlD domain-containing protein [Desulfocicer vacuolatum]SMC54522.1 Branched-chain amino acid transport protein [Desulfocicer vacuolatum DSM 3385]
MSGINIQLNEIYMLVGMTLVTFGIRYVMFPISGRFEFPALFQRGLRYVPPVVLTAIIVPSVLMHDGETLDLSLTNPYLIGAIAACVIGGLFKNLLLTIVVSMVIFLGCQWVFALG